MCCPRVKMLRSIDRCTYRRAKYSRRHCSTLKTGGGVKWTVVATVQCPRCSRSYNSLQYFGCWRGRWVGWEGGWGGGGCVLAVYMSSKGGGGGGGGEDHLLATRLLPWLLYTPPSTPKRHKQL